jgi:hypothetical protein
MSGVLSRDAAREAPELSVEVPLADSEHLRDASSVAPELGEEAGNVQTF